MHLASLARSEVGMWGSLGNNNGGCFSENLTVTARQPAADRFVLFVLSASMAAMACTRCTGSPGQQIHHPNGTMEWMGRQPPRGDFLVFGAKEGFFFHLQSVATCQEEKLLGLAMHGGKHRRQGYDGLP